MSPSGSSWLHEVHRRFRLSKLLPDQSITQQLMLKSAAAGALHETPRLRAAWFWRYMATKYPDPPMKKMLEGHRRIMHTVSELIRQHRETLEAEGGGGLPDPQTCVCEFRVKVSGGSCCGQPLQAKVCGTGLLCSPCESSEGACRMASSLLYMDRPAGSRVVDAGIHSAPHVRPLLCWCMSHAAAFRCSLHPIGTLR